jgi:hypothetical protein
VSRWLVDDGHMLMVDTRRVKTQTKTKDKLISVYTLGTLSEGALCGELKCLFPSGEKVKGTFLIGSSAHTSSSKVAPKHDRAYSPEALMK